VRHIAEAYWAVAAGLVWSCPARAQEVGCLRDVVVTPAPTGADLQPPAAASSAISCDERALGDNVVAAAWCSKNRQAPILAATVLSVGAPARERGNERFQIASHAPALRVDRIQGHNKALPVRNVSSPPAKSCGNSTTPCNGEGDAFARSPATKPVLSECGKVEMLTTAQDAFRRRSITSGTVHLIVSKPRLIEPNGSSF
jgi:hypothetical protein